MCDDQGLWALMLLVFTGMNDWLLHKPRMDNLFVDSDSEMSLLLVSWSLAPSG